MERGYAKTSLGQIHYRRMGRGQPLLLLHQAGRSSRMFMDLMGALGDGFDLIAPDLPGSGNSDPLPPGTRFETIASALDEVMAALGIPRFDVYGIHTGNKLGAALAAQSADRIRRVALAGHSHSLILDPERRKTIFREGLGDLSEAGTAALNWASRFPRVAELWLSRAALAEVADAGASQGRLGRVLDDLESMTSLRALYESNFEYPFERDLAKVAQPCLIIEIRTPHEDAAIGRQGPAVQGLIPHAKLVSVEEPSGHAFTLENRVPELAGLLRDFVA